MISSGNQLTACQVTYDPDLFLEELLIPFRGTVTPKARSPSRKFYDRRRDYSNTSVDPVQVYSEILPLMSDTRRPSITTPGSSKFDMVYVPIRSKTVTSFSPLDISDYDHAGVRAYGRERAQTAIDSHHGRFPQLNASKSASGNNPGFAQGSRSELKHDLRWVDSLNGWVTDDHTSQSYMSFVQKAPKMDKRALHRSENVHLAPLNDDKNVPGKAVHISDTDHVIDAGSDFCQCVSSDNCDGQRCTPRSEGTLSLSSPRHERCGPAKQCGAVTSPRRTSHTSTEGSSTPRSVPKERQQRIRTAPSISKHIAITRPRPVYIVSKPKPRRKSSIIPKPKVTFVPPAELDGDLAAEEGEEEEYSEAGEPVEHGNDVTDVENTLNTNQADSLDALVKLTPETTDTAKATPRTSTPSDLPSTAAEDSTSSETSGRNIDSLADESILGSPQCNTELANITAASDVSIHSPAPTPIPSVHGSNTYVDEYILDGSIPEDDVVVSPISILQNRGTVCWGDQSAHSPKLQSACGTIPTVIVPEPLDDSFDTDSSLNDSLRSTIGPSPLVDSPHSSITRPPPLPSMGNLSPSPPRQSRLGQRRSSINMPTHSGKARRGKFIRDTTYRDDMRRQMLAEERRRKQRQLEEELRARRPSTVCSETESQAPSFDDYEFLSKYCIFNKENLETYRRVFSTIDSDGRGWLARDEITVALKSINRRLSDVEETYIYRVLEMSGYSATTSGADFKLFSVIAALSQKISSVDSWMKNLIGQTDFRILDMKMFLCKKLWQCNVDSATNMLSLENLCVELQAGGVSLRDITEVRTKLFHLGSLDLLDFLTYVPLFIHIHETIVLNPLENVSLYNDISRPNTVLSRSAAVTPSTPSRPGTVASRPGTVNSHRGTVGNRPGTVSSRPGISGSRRGTTPAIDSNRTLTVTPLLI